MSFSQISAKTSGDLPVGCLKESASKASPDGQKRPGYAWNRILSKQMEPDIGKS
jgi:hypothetical protein